MIFQSTGTALLLATDRDARPQLPTSQQEATGIEPPVIVLILTVYFKVLLAPHTENCCADISRAFQKGNL